jgi:hypothetical protein
MLIRWTDTTEAKQIKSGEVRDSGVRSLKYRVLRCRPLAWALLVLEKTRTTWPGRQNHLLILSYRRGGTCSLAPHFVIRRGAHVCASARLSFGRETVYRFIKITTTFTSLQYVTPQCRCFAFYVFHPCWYSGKWRGTITTGIGSEPSMVEPPLTHISINQPPVDHPLHDAHSNSPSDDGAPAGQITASHAKLSSKANVWDSITGSCFTIYIIYIPFLCEMWCGDIYTCGLKQSIWTKKKTYVFLPSNLTLVSLPLAYPRDVDYRAYSRNVDYRLTAIYSENWR